MSCAVVFLLGFVGSSCAVSLVEQAMLKMSNKNDNAFQSWNDSPPRNSRHHNTGFPGAREQCALLHLPLIVPITLNRHTVKLLTLFRIILSHSIKCVSHIERIPFTESHLGSCWHWELLIILLSTPILHLCRSHPLAPGPGFESPLWRPQFWVHIQRFPFPLSGQLRASGLANANMLQIAQPQLPESNPGRLFPRWRHGIHGLGLLTSSDWHHCSHLQHQHWWVTGWKGHWCDHINQIKRENGRVLTMSLLCVSRKKIWILFFIYLSCH